MLLFLVLLRKIDAFIYYNSWLSHSSGINTQHIFAENPDKEQFHRAKQKYPYHDGSRSCREIIPENKLAD